MLGRAVVDDGRRLVGAEVLRGEDAGEGEVGVGGEVAQQGDVAVGEGAGQEGLAEVVQGRGGVGPGVQEMPDLRQGVELLVVPEAGEFVLGEQADERFVVVLVDGLEGGFTARFRGRGVLRRGEVLVGVAPFLGEVGP